jgi:ribosome-associated protein
MGDMLQTNLGNVSGSDISAAIGGLLSEHNGQDVCVLDLREINNWTDFFVIATVTSKTHMDGLERHIKDFCREKEIAIKSHSRKNIDDEWRLLDLGSMVVHLMNKRTREFYELERLWRQTPEQNKTNTKESAASL